MNNNITHVIVTTPRARITLDLNDTLDYYTYNMLLKQYGDILIVQQAYKNDAGKIVPIKTFGSD